MRVRGYYLAGLLTMAGSGAVYSFPSYAQSIKSSRAWQQHQIEWVGELLHIGVYMGPIIGLCVDLFSTSANFMIAGILLTFGYFGAASIVEFSTPNRIGFMFYCVGFGSGLLYNCTLACNMKNFFDNQDLKKRKGILVGFMVSLYGFGAIIFSSVFNSVHSTTSFLKIMAVIECIIAFLGYFFVRRVDKKVEFVQVDDSKTMEIMESGEIKEPKEKVSRQTSFQQRLGKSFRSILSLAKKSSFWLSFIALILGAGGGLMFINNVGNLIKSLNGGVERHDLTLECVSVLSVFNGLGRISMGLTDYTKINRIVFYVFALVLMSLAHLFCAFGLNSSIWTVFIASILVGSAYGMIWSILPTLVSELFGAEEFGLFWSWYTVGPAISSALFNSIAGLSYESHALPNSIYCVGINCYREAFLFASIAALLGAILSYLMYYQSKKTRSSAPTTLAM